MEERAFCQNCRLLLKMSMDIEYSKYLGDVFCSPDCATDYYYDYMRSTPVDCHDLLESELLERGLKIIDKELYRL